MTPPATAAVFRRPIWLCALLSIAAVVALVALLPGDIFLSSPNTDLVGELAASRALTAGSLRAGHLPLWNPYAYSGEPFLGNFLSAELYPPNLLFVFLPLARAVNLCFLLHLLLLGWGVWFWLTRRGYHPAAAALAGWTLALSGPVFLRLYEGHLAHVCTMAWAPWLFAALEMAGRGPPRKPLLLAAACVCLQILAGSPQYVFYCAIAAGLHALVTTVREPTLRRRVLPIFAMAYLGGVLLAAAQLLPAWSAAAESVRQGKLEWGIAGMLSLPPENLLLFIAPDFFGNLTQHTYWGRGLLWEVSPFVGTTGLVLAGLAFFDAEHRRRIRSDLLVAALLLVLAFGSHTPLLHWLYDYAPGFDKFRALAKFAFPVALLMTPAIGAGADAIIRGRTGAKVLAVSLVALGLIVVVTSAVLEQNPSWLKGSFAFIQTSHESLLSDAAWADPALAREAASQAGAALWQAGMLGAIVGVALLLTRKWPQWRWAPLALLPLEMASFAHANIASAPEADLTTAHRAEFIATHPGDYRVLDTGHMNNGYFIGAPDIWGEDPLLLKRYAEFITFTQGGVPDQATQYAVFGNLPPSFALLRFRFAFVPTPTGAKTFEAPYVLPRGLLVADYKVLPGRDAIFAELQKSNFDARKMVYLESEPTPTPLPGGEKGTVKVIENNSDALTVEADTPAPALLLITDLYSQDWQARALPDSAQQKYTILPADYIVRAIPLGAGHHHFLVGYQPPSFHWGLIISGLAWLGWVVMLVQPLHRAAHAAPT